MELQLALLPALLIGLAAILVDATFLSDAYRERIWAQLVLWLASSLQRVPQNETVMLTYVLINVSFFLSISSAAYQGYIVRFQWRNSIRNGLYSRFLAPSMIMPLLYSWIWSIPLDTESTMWIHCSALFCVTFLSLCAWRWRALQRQRARRDLVGTPTVDSLPLHHHGHSLPEEHLWTQWTPSQLLQWIDSLEADWPSDVCALLAPERIPGCVLDTLTVSTLRSMGIPYGPAQCLMDTIKELTMRYPSQRKPSFSQEDDDLHLDEWYGQRDDGETNASMQFHSAIHSSSNPSYNSSAEGTPGELDEQMEEKARDLFREQFGLELPKMRTRPGVRNDVTIPEETAKSPPTETIPPTNEDATEGTMDGIPNSVLESLPSNLRQIAEQRPELLRMVLQQQTSTGTTANGTSMPNQNEDIPAELVQSMPPHIREIAEQRPDLLRMVLQQRQSQSGYVNTPQQQSQLQSDHPNTSGMSRVHQLRMQDPSYAHRFVGAQAATGMHVTNESENMSGNNDDGSEEYLEDSSDTERMGLLRKRVAR